MARIPTVFLGLSVLAAGWLVASALVPRVQCFVFGQPAVARLGYSDLMTANALPDDELHLFYYEVRGRSFSGERQVRKVSRRFEEVRDDVSGTVLIHHARSDPAIFLPDDLRRRMSRLEELLFFIAGPWLLFALAWWRITLYGPEPPGRVKLAAELGLLLLGVLLLRIMTMQGLRAEVQNPWGNFSYTPELPALQAWTVAAVLTALYLKKWTAGPRLYFVTVALACAGELGSSIIHRDHVPFFFSFWQLAVAAASALAIVSLITSALAWLFTWGIRAVSR
jgi:hypothetical protein